MRLQRESEPDAVLFWLLLALIFWMPLPFGSNRPWAVAILEIWIFTLGICWLWLYFRGRVLFSQPFRQARPVLWLFAVYVVLIVFQVVPWSGRLSSAFVQLTETGGEIDFVTVSLDPHATTSALLLTCAYVLLFVLTLLVINSRERVLGLLYAIVMSGMFQAVYGSLMALSGLEWGFFMEKEYYRHVATGTFINRNHLAGYLEITLAVGIGLMIAMLDTSQSAHWKGRVRSWLRLLLGPKARLRLYLVVMVIALILTRSRMGNVAFFASMLVTGVMGIVLSRHAVKGTVILLASLVIIDIFLIGAWFGIDRVAERVAQTSIESEARVAVYKSAQTMWEDYKLSGTGLGSFATVYPKYRANDVLGFYRHAHNDYMQFATETGVVGLGLLGLIVIWSFVIAAKAQYQRHDPLMRGLSFAVMMGISARMIHASVEFNFQIPANAATFLILLALGWASLFHEERGVKRNRVR